MNKYKVVIGAGFGDEGKGLMTDYFARGLQPEQVVRFNGGAQAGHTVCTPSGNRRVFHHMSSGTFAGANTLLASKFIVNPILFNQEFEDMMSAGHAIPKVFIHPDCPITLPIDMSLNQLEESNNRISGTHHGSCGVGINRTMQRSNHELMRLPARAMHPHNQGFLFRSILQIYEQFYKKYVQTINSLDVIREIDRFLDEIDTMRGRVTIVQNSLYWEEYLGRRVVFEGAQGLLLDQDSHYFPHVTHSKTGLTNVLPIANKMDAEIDVTYVTRAYLTRHGRGPFVTEDPSLSAELKPQELTNVDNPWQESMRFGHLNVDQLVEAIGKDVTQAGTGDVHLQASLAVTCLDQREKHSYIYGGRLRENLSTDRYMSEISSIVRSQLGITDIWVSYGPTWKDVVQTSRR